MDRDELWKMIDRSRKADDAYAQLVSDLSELDDEAILSFNRLFCQCVTEAYRWDLLAVAEIINGSTQAVMAFDHFLGWLVSQGREYFEAAMADPVRSADRAVPGESAECPAIWDAAAEAYERRTGRDDFFDIADGVSAIMEGERLTEKEVRERFGPLIVRFSR